MTKTILLVSFYSPNQGHAGGLRLIELYLELKRIRPDLYIALLTFEHSEEDFKEENIEDIFDEMYRLPLNRFGSDFMRDIGFMSDKFDFIDLQYHQCGTLIGICRKKWPKAIVAFSPMESMIRAMHIRVQNTGSGGLREIAVNLWLSFQEMSYVLAADRVITVSYPDRNSLAWLKSKNELFCIPTGLLVNEFYGKNIASTRTIKPVVVFFAFFGSKTNREALIWYCREVHPLLMEQVAGYSFRVAGRELDASLKEMCASDGIDFVGAVESIPDALNGAAVGIAPALGGAGVRGKIHQYSAMRMPCVSSPIACQGLDYLNGDSILVADSALDFTAACVKLLKNKALREQVGGNAYQVCIENYTWNSMEKQIMSAYCI